MPSIQDVADQINAKLDQISDSTTATAQNTTDIKTELQQANNQLATIKHSLDVGFSNLGHGLFAISELQKVTISVLNHHSEQHNAIICLLENNNELLCGITRKLTKQLIVSTSLLETVDRIEGIEERIHAEAAIDYDRFQQLQTKVEKCCPKEEPRPELCPENCKTPEFKPPRPKGQKWKPLPIPKTPQIDPVE